MSSGSGNSRGSWRRSPRPCSAKSAKWSSASAPPTSEPHVRAIFEKEPFGELERLVTQTLLDVVKGVATEELENDYWLRMVAELSHRSYEETRVIVLEFLDTDIFHLSGGTLRLVPGSARSNPGISTSRRLPWTSCLNPRVVSGHVKRFEFIERKSTELFVEEPGLREFLRILPSAAPRPRRKSRFSSG